MKLHIRLKGQEPRLGQRRNLRGVRQIHHDEGGALTADFREMDRFRLDGLQDFAEFCAAEPSFTAVLNLWWGIVTIMSIRIINPLVKCLCWTVVSK